MPGTSTGTSSALLSSNSIILYRRQSLTYAHHHNYVFPSRSRNLDRVRIRPATAKRNRCDARRNFQHPRVPDRDPFRARQNHRRAGGYQVLSQSHEDYCTEPSKRIISSLSYLTFQLIDSFAMSACDISQKQPHKHADTSQQRRRTVASIKKTTATSRASSNSTARCSTVRSSLREGPV